MKFRKFRVKIFSGKDEYGFEYKFDDGLNIIRGDNSSGKSTLVNALIYSIGMEEIIGAKGPKVLPYALKSYLELQNKKISIIESSTIVEIENKKGKVKTFKRAITSKDKNTKLVQIIDGAYLTANEKGNFESKYTFLHDSGSAQDTELGFFAFFEQFIGLDLPSVSNNNGGESKLYLQAIFSSIFIEQKRGWTNYIANTPYYPISGLREKIVSFLMDLDNFRKEKEMDDLKSERDNISSIWSEISTSIKLILKPLSLNVSGLSGKPTIDFNFELVNVGEGEGDDFKGIQAILLELADSIRSIEEREKSNIKEQSPELVDSIEKLRNEISELMLLHKMSGDEVRISSSKIKQYQQTLDSVKTDLKKNRLTQKVNDFGAKINLKTAKDQCPTCLNPLDGTLAPPENESMPMTIDENIRHLENQKVMIESLLNGLEKQISKEEAAQLKIAQELKAKKVELTSYRKEMLSFTTTNETDIRRKVGLETRYSSLIEAKKEIDVYLRRLKSLSKDYQICQSSINNMSKFSNSYNDSKKIELLEEIFKELATKFGYRSAQVSDISIHPTTLIPYLEGLELREYSTDIKSDSSASDFVRLIWAYLISIYKVSSEKSGNQPGILLFDEPAQHSMGLHSVNEMLKEISSLNGLQSIVAASFDQSDAAFNESTEGVQFNLIRLPRKLIQQIEPSKP